MKSFMEMIASVKKSNDKYMEELESVLEEIIKESIGLHYKENMSSSLSSIRRFVQCDSKSKWMIVINNIEIANARLSQNGYPLVFEKSTPSGSYEYCVKLTYKSE